MRNAIISFQYVLDYCLRNFHRNYAYKNDCNWNGFIAGEATVRVIGLCQGFCYFKAPDKVELLC